MNLSRTQVLAALACLGAGIAVGYRAGARLERPVQAPRVLRQGGFKLINPLLDVEGGKELFKELAPFEYRVEKLVSRLSAQGEISHISVYFRDLNNGPWFGIKEDEMFAPASLMKIPILIAYLKWAESEPGLLQKRVVFTREKIAMETLVPSKEPLVEGRSYTVDEYLRRMITVSDNGAAYLLLTHIDANRLDQIYRDLGMSIPDVRTPADWISVRQFAAFFRILFNASYLNKEHSERALAYLTEVKFRDALVAGVPAGVVVAHKFGERHFSTNRVQQFHDCGIVYYPSKPYVLCVMTRGKDTAKLVDAIKDVSTLVYEEIYRGLKD